MHGCMSGRLTEGHSHEEVVRYVVMRDLHTRAMDQSPETKKKGGRAHAVPEEPAYPAEDGSVDGRECAPEERPLTLNARTSTNCE